MDQLPPMKGPKVVGKAYKAFTIENNLLYPVMVDNYEKDNTNTSKIVRVPRLTGSGFHHKSGNALLTQ